MRLWIALAAGLLLAAEMPASAEDVNCDKATNQNELNACAQDNYDAADKALNEAYRKTMSMLADDAARAKLRAEERAWIAQRDAACKAEAAESEGGSMYPTLYFGCMAQRTRMRTKTLQTYLR